MSAVLCRKEVEMNKEEVGWMRITRKCKNELQVEAVNSCYRDSVILQTEQGAMVEVGAILGANVLQLKDGDVLEIKLIVHRKEGGGD